MGEAGASEDPDLGLAVLLVTVAAEALALAAEEVVEVARLGRVTLLPGAARWVRGVAAVRGAILPIGDLLVLMSGLPAEPAEERRVVIVASGGRQAGLTGLVVQGVVAAEALAAGAERDGRAPTAGDRTGRLPVRGVVRPHRGGAPGAGPAAPIRLLDVGALLDHLLDDAPPHDGAPASALAPP